MQKQTPEMSAPAVPTADAGLLTSSTDGAPAVVSQEEIPQQNLLPSYAPRIGTLQDLDTYIRTHYIQIAKLNWNTSQLEGTILYTNQIHPLRANKIIRHLYKIFNTWTGGLDYKIKIAATGFNAGAIVAFRLPPNIDVSRLKTVENMTHFPHIIIEAKTLEMPTVEFIDQLRMFFHYTSDLDPANPDTFGGHLVIGVWSPLVAVGNGPSSVNIVISNKASQNFNYAQIIPPDLLDTPTTADDSFYKALLNFDNPVNLFGLPYAKIRLLDSVLYPTYGDFMSTTVKVDGTMLAGLNSALNHRLPSNPMIWASGGLNTNLGPPVSLNMKWHYNGINTQYVGYRESDHAYDTTASVAAVVDFTGIFPLPTDRDYAAWILNVNGSDNPLPVESLVNHLVTGNPESWIAFGGFLTGGSSKTAKLVFDAQMYNTAKLLNKVTAPMFDPTQAYLYTVYDTLVQLPLFHVKLYSSGCMTGPITTGASIDYDLLNLEFIPVGLVSANSVMPTANYANMVTARLAREQFRSRRRHH